jgi:hypothetical protein
MKTFSLTALLVALALLPWPSHAAESVLPADVLAFGHGRASCDHWRGESSYNREREIQINAGFCGACMGTDAKLDALKAKYKQLSDVLLVLNAFEPNVEGLRGSRAAQFCRSAYKKFFELQKKHESQNLESR